MFTGIVEATGNIIHIDKAGTNKTFQVQSPISSQLKIDQSVSHSGICLTVEAVTGDTHQVTAIAETLEKTNLDSYKPGDAINLERCLQMNGRLDGHMVQGHIDTTGKIIEIRDLSGSWLFSVSFAVEFAGLVIEKGSICLNGISLTIFNVSKSSFSVAIIPYTYANTNIRQLKEGDLVNLEFDMVGKYIARNIMLGSL